MRGFGSVHSRVIAGFLLSSVGIFAASTFVALTLVAHHPEYGPFVHQALVFVLAAGFAGMGFVVVRHGLSPLNQLRNRLADVRGGRERRISGDYPAEVAPLVSDLNALLEDREARVARAIARAGDLAHGLKTPLAVLLREADLAEAAGLSEVATGIRQQAERMRRQVDYHLAQARAAASSAAPGARALVAERGAGLVRALRRLHAERGLAIDVDVPDDLAVRCQGEDLDEMLGNLLDNACRFARTTVRLTAARDNGAVLIAIDDDGPGLEAPACEAVLQRGVRLDQVGAGSGLGLAIVRDLADLYGGAIELGRSSLGGLRARLRLPAG